MRDHAIELTHDAEKALVDKHQSKKMSDITMTCEYRESTLLNFSAFCLNWALEQVDPVLQVINYSWRAGDAPATCRRGEWMEFGEKPVSKILVNTFRNITEIRRGQPAKYRPGE